MTPPGFFTANGSTTQCPTGSFRAEWLPSDQATSCSACGEGVFSTPTDTLTVIDIVTEVESQVDIMTEPTGCCECNLLGLHSSSVMWYAASQSCMPHASTFV